MAGKTGEAAPEEKKKAAKDDDEDYDDDFEDTPVFSERSVDKRKAALSSASEEDLTSPGSGRKKDTLTRNNSSGIAVK